MAAVRFILERKLQAIKIVFKNETSDPSFSNIKCVSACSHGSACLLLFLCFIKLIIIKKFHVNRRDNVVVVQPLYVLL